jgi:hypothetical protein
VLLVDGKFVNQLAHGKQIISQHGFAGMDDGNMIRGHGEGREDQNKGDDHHQFDQGEAGKAVTSDE